MKTSSQKSIGYQLLHAARLHRARTAALLNEIGLFPGQEQVLQALSVDGGLTMGDLAGVLRVRPPTASKTVQRLSAQGLVVRKGQKNDARIVKVFLTEEGEAKISAIKRIWNEVEEEMTTDLDGKDCKRLRKLLRKASKNLSMATGAAEEPEDILAEDLDDLEEVDA